jgi:hypothetical protein
MPAPLIAGAAAIAARLAAKKAATSAAKKAAATAAKKKAAAKVEKRAMKNINKPTPKSKKPVEKITGLKPNTKAAPKSNVKTQKPSEYTKTNLDKIRTPEGNRRAVEAARKAEQLRIAKAERRMYEIRQGMK